jgi:hypothetical protein
MGLLNTVVRLMVMALKVEVLSGIRPQYDKADSREI